MLLKNILKRRLEIVFGLWQMVFGVRLRKVSSTKEKDSALEIVFSVWQLVIGLIHENEITNMLKAKDLQLKT